MDLCQHVYVLQTYLQALFNLSNFPHFYFIYIAGTDYIAASGTLVFSSGVSERVINVSIIDDDSIEVDEQFFVDLSNGESTTVVIEDNDILRKSSINYLITRSIAVVN